MKKILFLSLILTCLGLNSIAQDRDALFNSGVSKADAGQYKEALADFDAAIAKDPKFVNAYIKRAFCKIQMEDYKGAIADYTKVIEMKPDNKFAYLSRGAAKNKIKDFKSALADFDKVISMDPKNIEAYNNRGWAKKGLGDHEGACKDWKQSKKLGNHEAKEILKNNGC